MNNIRYLKYKNVTTIGGVMSANLISGYNKLLNVSLYQVY